MTAPSVTGDKMIPPGDEGSCLLKLLAQFDKSAVTWCLVGDTTEYPHCIGGDVDIVVEPSVLPKLEQFLVPFCHTNALRLVQVLQHELTARYFVLSWFTEDAHIRFLRLDFCSDYMHRGAPCLQAEEFLRGRIPVVDKSGQPKGFFVASPDMEFIYYLLKKVEKQELLPTHELHLNARWQENPEGARLQVERFWHGSESGMITQAAASGEWSMVRSQLVQLRRTLRRNLSQSPAAWFRELKRRAHRFLNPTGFMVAVLGPDGSGKSTVLKRCSEDLLPAFRRVQVFHLRPRIGDANAPASTPNSNPHGLPPRGVLTSIAKLGFLWLEYTLGYWINVRPLLVRSTLVLFDRYYHDLLVDPRRYRFASPMWLARLIATLTPKPDLWLVLDAPVDILQGRKQEVPETETARQLVAYRNLAHALPNCTVVDASDAIEAVGMKCNSAITKGMARRLERGGASPHD